MTRSESEDKMLYEVVMNGEQQYSVWPVDKAIPLGWEKAGSQGSKEQCLKYIDTVWTDMRPLSLRNQVEAMKAK